MYKTWWPVPDKESQQYEAKTKTMEIQRFRSTVNQKTR